MALPVLLPPRIAASARALLVADPAVDGVVYDLAADGTAVDPAGRFAAVYRAPAGRPGDFVVLGGFPSDPAASAALSDRPR